MRHVRDLSAAIRDFGGIPLSVPHVPTDLKLGVQSSGLPGGDRFILLAFVANEWQSRERYALYAARPYEPEIAARIERHAADEGRHYAGARDEFKQLGCSVDRRVGRAVQAFARFHGTSAEAIEAFGRGMLEAALRSVRPI